MGLENAQFISELDSNNPISQDPIAEGDDQLRMIKFVLLSTLGGLDAAVVLTSAQLNDVAIKGEANVFTIDQLLANGIALEGAQANDTPRSLAFVSIGDVAVFGDEAIDGLARAAAAFGIDVGGTGSARFVPRADGSLELADAVGVFGRALAAHLDNVVSGSVALVNGKALLGQTTDATPVNVALARLSPTNVREYGADDGRPNGFIGALHDFFAGTANVARATTAALGGLLVSDRSGNLRKVGFRNPTSVSVTTGPYTLTQDLEGGIVSVEGDNVDIYSPSLEADTTLSIIVGPNTGTTLSVGAGVSAINHLSGDGFLSASSYAIAAGSIVQVRWASATAVHIWGNGIS